MDADLQKQRVVIHTDSQYCFIGTLDDSTESWIRLGSVIVLNHHETRLSLEEMLLECIDGVHAPSRDEMIISRPRIVAMAKLSSCVAPGDASRTR